MKINWFRLIIIIVLLSAVGVYYLDSSSKAKLREEKQLAELGIQRRELSLKEESEKNKQEQERKAYIAKRKKDCYDIFESERKKFSNTDSNIYNDDTDICHIYYKTDQYKGVDCVKTYSGDVEAMTECTFGLFAKEF